MGLSPARLALLAAALALPRPAAATDTAAELPAAVRFDRLDKQVRDGTVPRAEARRALARLLPEVRAQARTAGCRETPRRDWVFPVAGYGPSDIGGRAGSGYRAEGYDYFDGNRHGGHPAHDIFIRDRDQDSRDDATGAPVPVRSVAGGLVVATNPAWTAGSPVRGGIYVWIYDGAADALVYYAHLSRLTVKPGECVAAGEKVGDVGRTGANAQPRRSPTHLHFSWLAITDGAPVPRDPYADLRRARRSAR